MVGGDSGRRRVAISLQPGATIKDVRDRRFKLSTRQAATAYRSAQPTVLMFGEPWIPTRNDAWTFDSARAMYRQRDGRLHVSERILDRARLEALRAEQFRIVLWRGEQWEYFAGAGGGPPGGVETVDDLSRFLGVPLAGRAINLR